MDQRIEENTSLRVKTLNEVSLANRIIDRFEKVTYSFNHILHSISSALLFLLMVLTALDVLFRNLFNSPITGTYELTGLTLAIMIFFSLGKVQISKEHIEIDFLTNKMPKKVQEGLYGFTSFILFILMALTTWQLFEYGIRVLLGNEISGDLGLPLYIFVFCTCIGSISFTLTYLLDSIKFLLKVAIKDES